MLQFDDGVERRDQGVAHFAGRVGAFPAFDVAVRGSMAAHGFVGILGQIRHVQCRQVFRVRGAVDVLVRGFLNQWEHGAADVGEVGDQAVVHDGVAAEGEGVIVDRGHGRARGGADVCEDGCRGRVGADGVEVGVVGGRLGVLVHDGPRAGRRGHEVRAGRSVPRHAEAVDVEQAVAQGDFLAGRLFAGSVGEEFREVVVVDLFGQAVLGRDEDVFQEAFLRRGDVAEPPTHVGRVGVCKGISLTGYRVVEVQRDSSKGLDVGFCWGGQEVGPGMHLKRN